MPFQKMYSFILNTKLFLQSMNTRRLEATMYETLLQDQITEIAGGDDAALGLRFLY